MTQKTAAKNASTGTAINGATMMEATRMGPSSHSTSRKSYWPRDTA